MKRKAIITLMAVAVLGLAACSSNAGGVEPVTSEVIETEKQQVIKNAAIVEDAADIEKEETEQEVKDGEEDLEQDAAGVEEDLEQDTAGVEEDLEKDITDVEEEPEQEIEEGEKQVVEEPIVQDDGRGNGAGESITESEANYFAEAEALWAEHSAELVVNWETFREVYAYERSTGLSQEEVYNELYEMFK